MKVTIAFSKETEQHRAEIHRLRSEVQKIEPSIRKVLEKAAESTDGGDVDKHAAKLGELRAREEIYRVRLDHVRADLLAAVIADAHAALDSARDAQRTHKAAHDAERKKWRTFVTDIHKGDAARRILDDHDLSPKSLLQAERTLDESDRLAAEVERGVLSIDAAYYASKKGSAMPQSGYLAPDFAASAIALCPELEGMPSTAPKQSGSFVKLN